MTLHDCLFQFHPRSITIDRFSKKSRVHIIVEDYPDEPGFSVDNNKIIKTETGEVFFEIYEVLWV